MTTKETETRRLAAIHYRVEPGVTRIHRIIDTNDDKATADESIKLLEANANTIAAGIVPLRFGPLPSEGIHHASVIIEVTPDEFRRIKCGELRLPNGWEVGRLIPKRASNGDG